MAVTSDKEGGLYGYHVQNSKNGFQPIPIKNKNMKDTDSPCFVTHGLYYSETSERLYAVTHHGTFSSVEIFKVKVISDTENNNNDGASASSSLELDWIRSVSVLRFPNLGLNDVVEGSTKNELYVTQWIPDFASCPPRGRKHADTWTQAIGQALLVPVFLLGLKLTKVHVCTFDDNPEIPASCRMASSMTFQVANGITKRQDDTGGVFIYVNDVTAYKVHEFERQNDGTLQPTGTVLDLTHAADNIDYRNDALFLGSITDLSVVFGNEQKKFQDRALVPGGLGRIPRLSNGTWGTEELLHHHDGQKLSQVSSGVWYDDFIYLGSPYYPGVLRCPYQGNQKGYTV